jgi:hypothetical protein
MKKLTSPQDEYIRTALRLPPDLHMEVKRAAKAAGHTMNAEIIARVADAQERVFCKDLLKQNAELKAMMREMLDAIELLK